MNIKSILCFATYSILLGALVGCQSAINNEQTSAWGCGNTPGSSGCRMGQTAGVALGVGSLGLVGNAIGRGTCNTDDQAAFSAFMKATQAPLGESVYWRNGRTGHWGYFCPLRDGHTRVPGDYCRELISTAHVKGKVEQTHGVVCRQPDGSWYAN